MQALKIRFFGPFTLSCGNVSVCEDGERSHKQWRLIKYLILNRDRAVARRELIDATFGYGAYIGREEDARNALCAMLHRARKTLGYLGLHAKSVITFEKNAYRFVMPEGAVTDTEVFEGLCEKIFSSGSVSALKEHTLEALDSYRGFFLDRDSIDEETRLAIGRYHSAYKRVFAVACGILRREQDFVTLARIAERATVIDPLCEEFCIEHVRALISLGEASMARESYQRSLAFFAESTALVTSEELRRLGAELGAGDGAVLVLPEKYAAKASQLEKMLTDALGEGVGVKISLI